MEYVEGHGPRELLQGGPLPLAARGGPGAGRSPPVSPPRTPPGSSTATSRPRTFWSTPERRAKILDFGLAKPLDGEDPTLTEHGAVLGTWRAMAPEQARGETADARSDLFSLGVLLYEMLTGVSPFAGRTAMETLRRLDNETPPPVTALRPEAPADLAAFVAALLEKEPARRPPDAFTVARDLQGIAARAGLELADAAPSASRAALSSTSGDIRDPGDAPTYAPLTRRPPELRPEAEATSLTGRVVRPQARRLAMVLIALLAIAAAGALLLERLPLFARPPLRVAVLRPAVAAGSGLDLAASGTLVAELRGLLALQGITALDPAQIGAVKGSAREIARAVSADEVLTAAIEGDGRNGYVSLRRVGADGATLWAEQFSVPLAAEDALLLANAVTAALRRGYSTYALRPGSPDLEVRAEDYAEFVAIKQRIDAGRGTWAPEVDHLDALLRRSPRFLDGQLLAASLAGNVYQDLKRPEYLARAHAFLERARGLGATYPPFLSVEIALAVLEGDWPRAEAALTGLEGLVPGDPIVLVQRARILQARGRDAEAAAILERLVVERPAWRNLLWLADLELRQGRVGAARRALEQALGIAPGNTWALSRLAELELLYGDLPRAERIYRELIAAGPQRSNLTNLGLVEFLLGDYAGAVGSYRRALALDPQHVSVMLNLADAEVALGRGGEARGHYSQVLASLERKSEGARLDAVERMVQAQCLARLGRDHEAVALALDVLGGNPKEAEVAYQAALVFALAGEDSSAIALAKKAVGLGVQPRWLGIPGFERLRADAAFRSLLSAPPAPGG